MVNTAPASLGPSPATGHSVPFDKDDHITALELAFTQLPADERGQVLVRTDSGG